MPLMKTMIASMDADLKTVEELANKHSGERPLVAFLFAIWS